MKWVLFLMVVNLTSPMDRISVQAIRSYADDDKATCVADGATMTAILNNPLHVPTGQVIVATCVNFAAP